MFNLFFAFVVSFLGSIPLGSLNLTALQIYLQSSFRFVVYFSLSASIIEFFYSYFALKGEIFISDNSFLNKLFSYITAVAFLFLGIINLRANSKPISENSFKSTDEFNISEFKAFRKGLLLSILNPQAIPFWLILTNFLEKENLVKFINSTDTFSYTIGVSLGTFFCLLSFAWIGGRFLKKTEIKIGLFNRVIGIIFLGVGLYQISNLI